MNGDESSSISISIDGDMLNMDADDSLFSSDSDSDEEVIKMQVLVVLLEPVLLWS